MPAAYRPRKEVAWIGWYPPSGGAHSSLLDSDAIGPLLGTDAETLLAIEDDRRLVRLRFGSDEREVLFPREP